MATSMPSDPRLSPEVDLDLSLRPIILKGITPQDAKTAADLVRYSSRKVPAWARYGIEYLHSNGSSYGLHVPSIADAWRFVTKTGMLCLKGYSPEIGVLCNRYASRMEDIDNPDQLFTHADEDRNAKYKYRQVTTGRDIVADRGVAMFSWVMNDIDRLHKPLGLSKKDLVNIVTIGGLASAKPVNVGGYLPDFVVTCAMDEWDNFTDYLTARAYPA